MRERVVILLLTFACFLSVQSQTVTNVQPKQVEKTIEVTYQLSEEADVALWVSFEGGQYVLLKKVSGDVGMNISKGRKKIVWNVLEEFSSFSYDDVRFKVVTTQSFNNYLKEKKKEQAKADANKKKQQRAYSRSYNSNYSYAYDGMDVFGGWSGFGLTFFSDFGSNSSVPRLGFWFGAYDNLMKGNHTLCGNIGLTVAVHPKINLFVGPGVGYDFGKEQVKFSAHGGLAFEVAPKFLITTHFAYPALIGVGLGFQFPDI